MREWGGALGGGWRRGFGFNSRWEHLDEPEDLPHIHVSWVPAPAEKDKAVVSDSGTALWWGAGLGQRPRLPGLGGQGRPNPQPMSPLELGHLGAGGRGRGVGWEGGHENERWACVCTTPGLPIKPAPDALPTTQQSLQGLAPGVPISVEGGPGSYQLLGNMCHAMPGHKGLRDAQTTHLYPDGDETCPAGSS